MNNRYFQSLMSGLTALLLVACSSDNDAVRETASRRPLTLSGVYWNQWESTRAASDVQILDNSKTVYVSSNRATPSPYQFDTSTSQFVVKQGSVPQEWDGSLAYVYGFFRSDNATTLAETYSVSNVQTGNEGYNFQASTQKKFTYTESGSGGVAIYLKQQLAKVQVTVADATAQTKVYMGNNQFRLSGNFGQNFTANQDEITGTWSLTGNGYTIEMSGSVVQGVTGRVYTAYVLPQQVALADQFFLVSDGSLSAYYALPSANFSFLAAHQNNCILMQNMYVASIQVDEEFANGSVTNVPTTAEAY